MPSNSFLSLTLAAALLSCATTASAAPRLADSFQYPIGGSTPGSVTPAQDQIDDFYNALDFAEQGTGTTANALHSGEDWQRNDASLNQAAPIIRASAAGDVVAVSSVERTVLIRHQVPTGTLANGIPSTRLADSEELYTLYRNIDTTLPDFNSQTSTEIPVAVARGDVIGSVAILATPALHFEMRTTEPNFAALYANAISDEGFYADIESLNAEGLIDPSDFIDGHRTIAITRGPQLYIHDDGDTLAQVDVRTGSLIGLSRLGRTLTDIAFAPSGELFGIDFDSLYGIDLATGGLTLIGSHGIPGGNALVFSANGQLYAAGNTTTELFLVDPTSASSTLLGDTGIRSSGDLAFFQDELYLAGFGTFGSSSDTLVRLQLEPVLTSTVVGDIGHSAVFGLATAADGNLYGTSGTLVLQIDPATGAGTPVVDYAGQGLTASNGSSFFVEAGAPQTVLASSILPTSRSVPVGDTATAFLSVINAGSVAGTDCVIAPRSEFTGLFEFQATNPATNAPVGTRNTPVDIAPNGLATFVIFVRSSQEREAAEFVFNVGCSNTELANPTEGLNTLLFSSTATPVPDVVALVATPTNDGVIDIDLANGNGAFALASANVGVADDIRVTLDTGAANQLPVILNLCETDSVGQCIGGGPAPSVTTSIAANATPTFSIFVSAQDGVDFRPELNRVYVRFRDSNGVIRGSTSVAVRAD